MCASSNILVLVIQLRPIQCPSQYLVSFASKDQCYLQTTSRGSVVLLFKR